MANSVFFLNGRFASPGETDQGYGATADGTVQKRAGIGVPVAIGPLRVCLRISGKQPPWQLL